MTSWVFLFLSILLYVYTYILQGKILSKLTSIKSSPNFRSNHWHRLVAYIYQEMCFRYIFQNRLKFCYNFYWYVPPVFAVVFWNPLRVKVKSFLLNFRELFYVIQWHLAMKVYKQFDAYLWLISGLFLSLFSRSAVSFSQLHGLQHARLLCPHPYPYHWR